MEASYILEYIYRHIPAAGSPTTTCAGTFFDFISVTSLHFEMIKLPFFLLFEKCLAFCS